MLEIQDRKTGEIIIFPTPEGGPISIDTLPAETLSFDQVKTWFEYHNKWKSIPWYKRAFWRIRYYITKRV